METLEPKAAKIITKDPMDLSDKEERVKQFLPGNYTTVVIHGELYVIGIDSAGWTMDDYVKPRLASGLIFVEEA